MEWDDFKKNILCNRKLGIINIIIGLTLIALGIYMGGLLV